MYGGGYVSVNLGILPFRGLGTRSNRIFDILEYARNSFKPVLGFMRGIYESGPQSNVLTSWITNFVNYVYYENGLLNDETHEPTYVITTTYTANDGEIKTKSFWVKKEEN